MHQDHCILTTKDFTIVEVMRERCLGLSDPMRPILDRKLETARVVFREDVPPTLATVSSRIAYMIDGRDGGTRILSHGSMNTPTGLYLPITTLRGLALLGLTEGQEFGFIDRDGKPVTVRLESVQYQPEAARQERDAALRLTTPEARRSAFRVVGSGTPQATRFLGNGFDDPGPSAA